VAADHPGSLATRLLTYQAERFPLLGFLPLMAAGTFAALAFSRAARGVSGMLLPELGVGTATLVAFFFVLRVMDEHKDAAGDAVHRPGLPVPRGLVALGELRAVAAALVVLVVAANLLVEPRLLVPMAAVLVWSALMAREFFVGDWLRARPLAYLLSHMAVMPLIFLYATALDWLPAAEPAPDGTGRFLAFAFFNGLVIEIGRKIRWPAGEREGVDTYSATWGLGPALGVWLASIAVALVNASLAAAHYDAAGVTALGLAPLAVASASVVLPLLRTGRSGSGRRMEAAAGLWVLTSYVTLGGIALWAGGGSG
jgi:hypothetical protein